MKYVFQSNKPDTLIYPTINIQNVGKNNPLSVEKGEV